MINCNSEPPKPFCKNCYSPRFRALILGFWTIFCLYRHWSNFWRQSGAMQTRTLVDRQRPRNGRRRETPGGRDGFLCGPHWWISLKNNFWYRAGSVSATTSWQRRHIRGEFFVPKFTYGEVLLAPACDIWLCFWIILCVGKGAVTGKMVNRFSTLAVVFFACCTGKYRKSSEGVYV